MLFVQKIACYLERRTIFTIKKSHASFVHSEMNFSVVSKKKQQRKQNANDMIDTFIFESSSGIIRGVKKKENIENNKTETDLRLQT